MISFSKLGQHGRLGNCLFQIAATIGLADRYKTNPLFPKWNGFDNFEFEPKTWLQIPPRNVVNERIFHYDEALLCEFDKHNDVDLYGYFQSEKYFENCRQYVKRTLEFKKDLIDQVRRKYYAAWYKKTIAIHIRRGDYVGNTNYAQLPITYFLTALFEHFPDWQQHNLIIFSDDIGYCKVHFDCIDNVFFAEGNSDIEDLCLMSQCDHFILSNSSYSWWGAWLGEKKGTKVVRPTHHFSGELLKSCDIRDFYPARWIAHDHQPNGIRKLIDLSDVTFTIPVMYDHPDRKQNLDLCVCMLQHYFNTTIVVGEMGGNRFEYMKQHCVYIQFVQLRYFHRTKMLNEMAKWARTPIVANWDADVMVSPLQLWVTVNKIRNGADVVYPYEWMFARIPRKPWFKVLEQTIDIGMVKDSKFNGMNNGDAVSVGGAVLFNKMSFIEGGMENENFISFGPEDAERFYRFTTLGYRVERTLGPIYHINHYVGPNSSNRHPHVNQNRAEWDKIQRMDKKALKQYVYNFNWVR